MAVVRNLEETALTESVTPDDAVVTPTDHSWG